MKKMIGISFLFILFLSNNISAQTEAGAAQSLKVYQNYDFVPGDKILFEDNFIDDQDGEFPAHWALKSGQAFLNKINGEEAFFLTDGNYAIVFPRMKTEKYLTNNYTIEYDIYAVPGSFGLITFFQFYDKKEGYDRQATLHVGLNETNFAPAEGNSLSKTYTEENTNSFVHK